MAVFTAKVPVAVATGIICFVVGGGLVGAIMSYSVKPEQQAAAAPAEDEKGDLKGKGGPPGAPGAGGKGGKGGKGGAPGGAGGGPGGAGGAGGGKGPGPKVQLAQLVTKLDVLTKKPLSVELTADQKKQAKELLAGLDAKDELSDEDAKAKLDALLKLVEGSKETLEAAGYRWPGSAPPGGGMGGMGGAPPPANPFKAGDGAERLKSFQTTLSK